MIMSSRPLASSPRSFARTTAWTVAAVLAYAGAALAPGGAPVLLAAMPAAPLASVVDAHALAQRIAGAGVSVANASYRGASSAIAPFVNGGAAVGIASGVVLSTGLASATLGPRGTQGLGTALRTAGDPVLDARAAPGVTEDAAVLTFDVTSTQDTIAIRYAFGSDEYAGTLQQDHGDVLSIEVNGVSCANVAGRPVSVTSINADVNAAQFIANEAGGRPTPLAGLTVPLECVATVTPHVPAHVRIAIADTGDAAYDSAVFVAEGGMRAVTGMAPSTTHLAKAVEFRRVAFEQYFVTSDPAEIASLTTGALAHDWRRTGEAFDASIAGTAGMAPVCRFLGVGFLPQGPHFFTAATAECATLQANAAWQFESIPFAWTPVVADGACPAGTRPIYRLFNAGMGGAPGHRYTTSEDVAGDMRLKGWIAEGAGPGVVGCAAS